MKKIDTNGWNEFTVEYLFRVLKCSKKVGQKETNEEGKVPVYSSESLNNGIVGYCNLKPSWIVDHENPLYLIFGDHTRTFHIADSSFCVADNVKVLLPLHAEMSVKVLQYISSVWQKEIPDLGYSRHWSAAKKLKILLPSKDGVPNWQFMEEYMRHIEQHVQSTIFALKDAQSNPLKIDHSNWKMFDLKRLFDIVLSKGDIQAKKMKEGDIPLVSSGKFNNGICKYIAEGDGKAEMFDANVITTDMFGKSYFQDKPFYAVSHGRVNILLPLFRINSYIAKFLVSVLDASFLSKYSFSGMCCQKELQKEKILLPAKGDEPDWHYMEMYMRGVEAIVKNKLSLLVPHKPELTIQDAASITFNGANVTYIDNSKNYSLEK